MVKYLVIENEYFASMKLIKLVSAVRSDYKPAFCVESVEDAVELLRTGPDIDLIYIHGCGIGGRQLFRYTETGKDRCAGHIHHGVQ